MEHHNSDSVKKEEIDYSEDKECPIFAISFDQRNYQAVNLSFETPNKKILGLV